MTDVAGKELRNRAIVLFFSQLNQRLCYGVIDQIYTICIDINGVYEDGSIFGEGIYKPEWNVLQVKHTQLPDKLKEDLIKLSKYRI